MALDLDPLRSACMNFEQLYPQALGDYEAISSSFDKVFLSAHKFSWHSINETFSPSLPSLLQNIFEEVVSTIRRFNSICSSKPQKRYSFQEELLAFCSGERDGTVLYMCFFQECEEPPSAILSEYLGHLHSSHKFCIEELGKGRFEEELKFIYYLDVRDALPPDFGQRGPEACAEVLKQIQRVQIAKKLDQSRLNNLIQRLGNDLYPTVDDPDNEPDDAKKSAVIESLQNTLRMKAHSTELSVYLETITLALETLEIALKVLGKTVEYTNLDLPKKIQTIVQCTFQITICSNYIYRALMKDRARVAREVKQPFSFRYTPWDPDWPILKVAGKISELLDEAKSVCSDITGADKSNEEFSPRSDSAVSHRYLDERLRELLPKVRVFLEKSEVFKVMIRSRHLHRSRLVANFLLVKGGTSSQNPFYVTPDPQEWEFFLGPYEVYFSPSHEDNKTNSGNSSHKTSTSEDSLLRLGEILSHTDRTTSRYRPLDEAKGEIRVLDTKYDEAQDTLFGTLVHISLKDWDYNFRPFVALSYTWAGQQATDTIVLNGSPFSITPNLGSALRSKSILAGNLPIWADAICINQADLEERSRQVLRMRQIYRAAVRTFIWLGPEFTHSNDALDLLESFNFAGRYDDTPLDKQLAELRSRGDGQKWAATRQLLQHEWWTRLWIIQEAVVSKSIIFVCGDKAVSWSTNPIGRTASRIAQLLDYDDRTNQNSFNPSRLGVSRLMKLSTLREMWEPESSRSSTRMLYRQHGTQKTYPTYLLSLLETSRDSLSSEPLDKIFGVLSLAFDGELLITRPNYALSMEQVCGELVKSYVDLYQNLKILCSAGLWQKNDTLPTWVPDWSDRSSGRPICPEILGAMPSSDIIYRSCSLTLLPISFSDDSKCLKVWGHRIGVINQLPGKFERSLGKTRNRIAAQQHYNEQEKSYTIFERFLKVLIVAEYNSGSPVVDVSRNSVFHHGWQLFQQAFLSGSTRTRHDPLAKWLETHLDFEIEDRPLRDILAQVPEPLGNDVREEGLKYKYNLDLFRRDFIDAMTGRTIFTASNGCFGIARDAAMPGDIVVDILGSPTPIVLRQHHTGYQLVGDACVDSVKALSVYTFISDIRIIGSPCIECFTLV